MVFRLQLNLKYAIFVQDGIKLKDMGWVVRRGNNLKRESQRSVQAKSTPPDFERKRNLKKIMDGDNFFHLMTLTIGIESSRKLSFLARYRSSTSGLSSLLLRLREMA